MPDKWGNHFPPKEDCVIVVSKTANSSGLLTLDITDKVFLPFLDIKQGETPDHQSTVLVDDFRGHSAEEVKERTLTMTDFLRWEIMAGGITPKAQPLDVLINKVFKGYFRDLFESWSLNAPLKPDGNPMPPSRQLLAGWVMQAWNKVPTELVKKSWDVCSYKATDELTKMSDDRASSLVVYSQQELGSVVERAAGGLAQTHFLHDHENNAEPMFPEEGDENEQEHEAPGYSNGVSRSAKKKPTKKKGNPTKKRSVGRGTGSAKKRPCKPSGEYV